MKMPSRARSSGDIASRSLPPYTTSPAVTWYRSRPERTCASVLLPEPLGPMMACTSPAFRTKSMPLRISRPATLACRFLISSNDIVSLSDASFETDSKQLLGFHGELHGQLAEDLFAEAVHDHGDRVFGGNAALPAIENLVFADLRSGCLVLHLRRRILHFEVGERVRAALIAQQHGIALRIVARVGGAFQDLDRAAIGVLAVPRRDALGDDGAGGVLADVDHFGARVGLLVMIGERHRVKFADRVVADQQAAWIFPGDGGAGFHLRPGDLGVDAPARAALGDEIVDAAAAFLIARIPVLHGRVLDLGVIEGDQFDHGRVQLVSVAHGRRTAFQVADVRAFVGDDESALELARILGVDAEVGGQLHGAAHALGDVAEGAVAEDGRVQGREEIVRGGDHRAEVFLDQVGVLLDGFGERAEDDAQLTELFFEGGGYRYAVEHRVRGDAGEQLTLLQRDAKLFIGAEQFRIDIVEALGPVDVGLGGGVVADGLVIDGRIVDVGPGGLLHGEPVPVGLQAPLQHELGLVLLL